MSRKSTGTEEGNKKRKAKAGLETAHPSSSLTQEVLVKAGFMQGGGGPLLGDRWTAAGLFWREQQGHIWLLELLTPHIWAISAKIHHTHPQIHPQKTTAAGGWEVGVVVAQQYKQTDEKTQSPVPSKIRGFLQGLKIHTETEMPV